MFVYRTVQLRSRDIPTYGSIQEKAPLPSRPKKAKKKKGGQTPNNAFLVMMIDTFGVFLFG